MDLTKISKEDRKKAEEAAAEASVKRVMGAAYRPCVGKACPKFINRCEGRTVYCGDY